MDKAKKANRVKYHIVYQDDDGKAKWKSMDSFDDLNGYSIEDARAAEVKFITLRSSERHFRMRKVGVEKRVIMSITGYADRDRPDRCNQVETVKNSKLLGR
jgi:hypothetical protein